MNTPWGKSDHEKVYARGIVFYGTPRHGGFHVSKKLNEKIPDYLRNNSGWYEEDCEWAKVAVIFPDFFSAEETLNALKTLQNYYWESYERFTGDIVDPEKSHSKGEALFLVENKNNYVVVSALAGGENVRVVAVRGGRLKSGQFASSDTKSFLLSGAEYKNGRGRFGFVIDLRKHKDIQMKLLTKELAKKFPALYTTDGQRGEQKVIAKFFTPDSNWTWFALEAEFEYSEEGEIIDARFFGLVDGFEKELGYFVLSELQSARGPMGLPIERDLHFYKKTLREAAPDFCARLWD